MKHKSWIKNYEKNFGKLAAEIGDLRYDALAEFLELLGHKIEGDGQKDKSRGRVQLANNLQNAAKALIESSKNIKEAWRICEPYMFPKDIVEKIKTDFKDYDKIRQAFELLSDYYRNWDDDVDFRLARCLLYETNGNIEVLKANISLANIDPRDIIRQAEYDNFNRPFGAEKLRQEDWNDDELPFQSQT